MIRLTIHAKIDPEIYLFNKPVVLLGNDSEQVDLKIEEEEIQGIHLEILVQNGMYVLVNLTKDPFVTVNGHSFGKKLLNSGDVILVHETPILFEKIEADQTNAFQDNEENPSKEPFLQESSTSIISFPLPFEGEVDPLPDEELSFPAISQLVAETKEKEEKGRSPSAIPNETKDDDPPELDNKENYLVAIEQGSHLYQAWKWILAITFSLIIALGTTGFAVYLTVSDTSEAEETKVAQAVADIGVALTYAQLNEIKPFNQNWSDIEFLKANLQAVLPDTMSYASQIDAQGQLHCCPYSLRIYTNSSLSRFLLIAQPPPSILYWIIPQSIIALDSEGMELHTLTDVRGINRLLANPDPLDGVNGREIATLIKQSPAIYLSTLAVDLDQPDFAPPKNLALIQPGAENFIYNSPRYYRLGQHIARKIIRLSTTKGSSQDVAWLKKNVKNLEMLHHPVLYAEQGKKGALLMQQGLMLFAPSNKFLFGYLLFNEQGKIHQAQILKEEEFKEHLLPVSKEGEMIAFQTPNEEKEEENFREIKRKKDAKEVDRNHPIYIQLQSQTIARENELKPLMAAMSALIQQEFRYPKSRFQFEFQELAHVYLMANHKHKKAMRMTLESLYKQYENIPTHEFFQFIEELHLDQLIQNQQATLALIDENCLHNIELLIQEMKNCTSLTALDSLVHTAMSWLHFDFFPDPADLIKYQNLLRNELLHQLEEFLLTDKKNFKIKSEKREMLERILSQERLIKPEEKEFFMEEFEYRILSQYPLQTKNE